MLFKNRAQVFKQLKIKGKERVNLLKLVTVVENIEEDTEILDIRILGRRLKQAGYYETAIPVNRHLVLPMNC